MIHKYEDKLLSFIDENIEIASEDDLFAGGYLRGHISLSVAHCEENMIDDVVVMRAVIEKSLNDTKSELSPLDQVLVQDYWAKILDL